MKKQLEQLPRLIFNSCEIDDEMWQFDKEQAEIIRRELDFADKAYDALKMAAQTFRNYEENHLQKSPPDFKKAERNGRMAKMIEDILSPTVNKDPEVFEEDER